ncbi:MAG: hypothetical protein INF43_05075 [Alphaproteobacteria bacterium]|jgi:hypothetical protein|nr:hypothetical protein [Alphaproteobacteria bacterium]
MDCAPYTLLLPPAPAAELRVYQLSPGAQVQLSPLWERVEYRVEDGHLVLTSAGGGTVLLRDYLPSLHHTRCPAALTLPKGAKRAQKGWRWRRQAAQ